MATTIRPNPKPGKLSSKFGAAFATFENNSGESNVPHAFRSATTRNRATHTVATEEKPKTRFCYQSNTQQRRCIHAEKVSGLNSENEDQSSQDPAASAVTDSAEQIASTRSINSTSTPAVKRSFRVASKPANQAKVFEESESSSNVTNDGNKAAFANARQGLRKVKQTTFVETADSKFSSEPAPNTGSRDSSHDENDKEDITTNTDNVVVEEVEDDNSDDEGSECYGFIDFVIKDTAHSTIGGVNSDGEYEEFWEEETLDSTEEEADDWSYQTWEEETVEDGVVEEEEEVEDEG
ncbi:MAG: hypothetical protein SGBAC_012730 [Bacillariaceae sp.]